MRNITEKPIIFKCFRLQLENIIMKTILIFILMLVGMMSCGQTLKLMNVFIWNQDGHLLWHYEYTYDDNFNLERIDKEFFSDIWSYYYSNDTLVMQTFEYAPGDTAFTMYDYYADSIVEFDPNIENLGGVYLLDSDGHITSYESAFISRAYLWADDNCISRTDNGVNHTITYHTLTNPFYEENKYFKLSVEGSVNFDNYTIGNGYNYNNIVTETIGNYPLKVERYIDGELSYKYQFDYEIINDVPEAQPGYSNVFSIDYYDILGRKIPKPNKGFYIERKTTDQGIVSKKYFIQ